jgi:hypothetical protein
LGLDRIFVGEFEMAGREDAQNVGFVGVSLGEKEDIPRGLKPLLFLGFHNAGAKAPAYLRSNDNARSNSRQRLQRLLPCYDSEVWGRMIKFVRKGCMDEGMVSESFSCGIVGDVEELVAEVLQVANAVFVKAFLPYLPSVLVADCERESSFDELGRFFN